MLPGMGAQLILASLPKVDQIALALRDHTFGTTKVIDARLEVKPDANGESALFIEVTLSDPSGETWPTEDVLSIRRKVLEVARRIPPLELPIYLNASPETDIPQEGDEQLF
jgi:hypothetical protein